MEYQLSPRLLDFLRCRDDGCGHFACTFEDLLPATKVLSVEGETQSGHAGILDGMRRS